MIIFCEKKLTPTSGVTMQDKILHLPYIMDSENSIWYLIKIWFFHKYFPHREKVNSYFQSRPNSKNLHILFSSLLWNIFHQCQVLALLAQLIQLRVNYCLLDSDQIFIGFIIKQFEFIEEGQIRCVKHVVCFLNPRWGRVARVIRHCQRSEQKGSVGIEV